VGSGCTLFGRAPTTALPSNDSKAGPTKWTPTGRPLRPESTAAGSRNVQAFTARVGGTGLAVVDLDALAGHVEHDLLAGRDLAC
jgi:hypothetical protein